MRGCDPGGCAVSSAEQKNMRAKKGRKEEKKIKIRISRNAAGERVKSSFRLFKGKFFFFFFFCKN